MVSDGGRYSIYGMEEGDRFVTRPYLARSGLLIASPV
jgi:hypothetical protein